MNYSEVTTMGRPPIGKQAMTRAQIQHRWRARKRQHEQATAWLAISGAPPHNDAHSTSSPPRETLSGIKIRPREERRVIDPTDIPAIKGMLLRGDQQADIAAYFGINGGRVSEINTGRRYANVKPLAPEKLPRPGPYMAARSADKARETLEALHALIGEVLQQIELWEYRGTPQ